MKIHYDHYMSMVSAKAQKLVAEAFERGGVTQVVAAIADEANAWAAQVSTNQIDMYDNDISSWRRGNLPGPIQMLHAGLRLCTLRDVADSFSFAQVAHKSSNTNFLSWAVNRAWAGQGDLVNQTAVREAFHVWCFEEGGQKVLAPSAGLSDELLHTEVKNLRVDDLKEPYHAFYVLVPEELELYIYNGMSGWHPVEGIHMVREVSSKIDGWRFLIVGKSKNPSDKLDNALMYTWLGRRPGAAESPLISEAITSATDLMSGKEADCPDDSVPPWIREASAKDSNWAKNAATTGRALQWAMNVVFYLNTADVEREVRHPDPAYRQLEARRNKAPKNSGKRKKLSERLRTFGHRKFIYLGDGIPRLKTRAGKNTIVYVKGHERTYWTGPKTGEQTKVMRWIRPYRYGKGDTLRTVLKIEHAPVEPISTTFSVAKGK